MAENHTVCTLFFVCLFVFGDLRVRACPKEDLPTPPSLPPSLPTLTGFLAVIFGSATIITPYSAIATTGNQLLACTNINHGRTSKSFSNWV